MYVNNWVMLDHKSIFDYIIFKIEGIALKFCVSTNFDCLITVLTKHTIANLWRHDELTRQNSDYMSVVRCSSK